MNSSGVSYDGNLQYYKIHFRPTARKMYGGKSIDGDQKIKHHQNVREVLKILALNGELTTWEIAKIRSRYNNSSVRTNEKECRRLLLGRIDRGVYSSGIVNFGLVVIDGKTNQKDPSIDKFRLSLHGLLYCFDVLDLSNNEIDVIATKYSEILPLVFGKWSSLKSILQNDIYMIKMIGKGFLLDDVKIVKISSLPYNELISFFSTKYQQNYAYCTEIMLAKQLSYCFYITMLYFPFLLSGKPITKTNVKKQIKYFLKDDDLKILFNSLIDEAVIYHKNILSNLEKISSF